MVWNKSILLLLLGQLTAIDNYVIIDWNNDFNKYIDKV